MPDYTVIVPLFLLRVMMGLRFVFPGWMLIIQGHKPTKEYLVHTTGPLAPLFKKMAKSKIIDQLNKWGLFLSGLALVFGLFVGVASYVGILLMLAYWLSKFPPKPTIIDERIVYICVLLILVVLQAGFFWGFDFYLLQIPAVANIFIKNLWLRWLI